MNSYYEHHKDSIRFRYRCFDRILLNGLIQPFQQPERVVGFLTPTGSYTRWAGTRCMASPIAFNNGWSHGRKSAIYPDSLRNRQKSLASGGWPDSDGGMIRGGFLSEEDRKALIALARDGSRVCRVTRRANALVLLDDGMSCQEVARVLLFDDDTIRDWHALFEQRGIEGLV
jgi:hypothetical protein